MAILISNRSLNTLVFFFGCLIFMGNLHLLQIASHETQASLLWQLRRFEYFNGGNTNDDDDTVAPMADASQIKIIGSTNFNYHQVALAWYDRLEELGYTEQVIIATDPETVQAIPKNDNHKQRKFETWLTPNLPGRRGHLSMFARRWQYVLQQLRKGVSVLLTDVDNIFNSHVPLESFMDYDIIFAYATPWPQETFDKMGFSVCGGMTWLQATPSTIDYVERIVKRCRNACDDQIVINKMLAYDLDITWDEPVEPLKFDHSDGVFQNMPYKERTGRSAVTKQRIKIWSMDFAYRGPMFPDVCPGPDNWVAMPEDYRKRVQRRNIHRHKLSFFNTWDNFCGKRRAAGKLVGLANNGKQSYVPKDFDMAECLTNTLQHLPIGRGRKPREKRIGRDMAFAHHYDAGNDEFWNEGIRFVDMMELKKAPCSIWEIGAHTRASDSRHFSSQYPICKLHAYEPNPIYFAELKERWENEPRMSLHNYGLGAQNSTYLIDRENSEAQVEGKIASIDFALKEAFDEVPTLFHMNCKGTLVCLI